MTLHRYPTRSLLGDYARALVGLGLGTGILVSVPWTPVVLLIFGGATGLFLVFGLRTLERQLVRVRLDRDMIRSTGLRTRVLPWRSLERFSLHYYGARRQTRRLPGQRRAGYMQLTLRGSGKGSGKGSGVTLRLESSIEGFETIVRHALEAARENGITLDSTSTANLAELEIAFEADPEADDPEGPDPAEEKAGHE